MKWTNRERRGQMGSHEERERQLDCLSGGTMNHTRGELLTNAICFALTKCKIHGRKGVLTEADRDAIAETVTEQLRQYKEQWDLDAVVEIQLWPTWDWSPHGK